MDKLMSDNIFGTFLLGEEEYAIPVNEITEVIDFDSELDKVPMMPDYFMGIFTLRSSMVPVVDINFILNQKKFSTNGQFKIAIVKVGNSRMGLAFSQTSEIINMDMDPNSSLEKFGGDEDLFPSFLKMDSGSKLIKVLNCDSLLGLKNIEKALTDNSSIDLVKESKDQKMITFSVEKDVYGVDIKDIREIISVDSIQKNILNYEFSLGVMNLRGTILPLLDLRVLIDSKREKICDAVGKKALVVELDGVVVGLVVDFVNELISYGTEDIRPVPLSSKVSRDGFYSGVLHLETDEYCLCIRPENILTNNEIFKFSTETKRMTSSSERETEHVNKHGSISSLLNFTIDQPFCVPISEISEIVEYDEKLVTKSICNETGISGILNLRGDSITLVDLYHEFSLTDSSIEQEVDKKVLIVQKESEKFGFVVKDINSIIKVFESQIFEIPSLMSREMGGYFKNDIKEYLFVDDELDSGKMKAVLIFSFTKTIERLMREEDLLSA